MTKLADILIHYPEISGIHPACDAVPKMDDAELDELTADIRKNGLANPITLTKEGLLLDGRHRLLACYEALQEVRFEHSTVEPWTYVCSLNIKRRHLTTGQKSMFAQSWFEHEKALAKERQREHGGTAPGKKRESLVATLPQVIESKPESKSRDKVAAKVGVGQKSIDKAATIREHAPEIAEKVRHCEIELEPAYREAQKIKKQKESLPVEPVPKQEKLISVSVHLARIITVDGKIKEIQEPSSVRFNRTNNSVDWARWTWNPITGCNHGCVFCYAREIANQERMQQFYPFGFEPAFHEYRLSAPVNTKVPNSDDAREKRVFVCSMADLFGKWVPEEWIRKVFDACLDAPAWEYLFLTKWPNKYAQMPLLPHAWYGASVIQRSDVKRIESAMSRFEGDGITKWISMEPMLEHIEFGDLSWCDLVVIGSQTSTNQPSGFVPAIAAKFDDIVDVINQCREQNVPYYLKANVGLDNPGMDLPKMLPKKR